MNRKLFIFVLIIFLVACSNQPEIQIHESVEEGLATDSLQVLEILEEAVNKKEKPNESDAKVLDTYVENYGFRHENGSLEDVNNDIYVFIELGIDMLDTNITMDSGKQNLEDLRISVTSFIENGDTTTNSYSK